MNVVVTDPVKYRQHMRTKLNITLPELVAFMDEETK